MKPIMYLAGYTGDGGLITIDWVGALPKHDAWVTAVVRGGKEYVWLPANHWWERSLLSDDDIVRVAKPLTDCKEWIPALIKITNGRTA